MPDRKSRGKRAVSSTVVRTCAGCGSQTVIVRCAVCCRQDAANDMMDRITELRIALAPAIEGLNLIQSATERSAVLAVLVQEARDLLDWHGMAAKLKFKGLAIPREHAVDMQEGNAALETLIAALDELLPIIKRRRIQLVSQPERLEAVAPRRSRKRRNS